MPISLLSFIFLTVLEFGYKSTCNLTTHKTAEFVDDFNRHNSTNYERPKQAGEYEEWNIIGTFADVLDENSTQQKDGAAKYKPGSANKTSDLDSIKVDSINKSIDLNTNTGFVQRYLKEDSVRYELQTEQPIQREDRLNFDNSIPVKEIAWVEHFINNTDDKFDSQSYTISVPDDPYYDGVGSRTKSTESEYSLMSSIEWKTNLDKGEKNFFSTETSDHANRDSIEATLNLTSDFITEKRNILLFNDSNSSTPVSMNINYSEPDDHLNHSTKTQSSIVLRHESSNNKTTDVDIYDKTLSKPSDVDNDKCPARIEMCELESVSDNSTHSTEVSSVSTTQGEILNNGSIFSSTKNQSSVQGAFAKPFQIEKNCSMSEETEHIVVDRTELQSNKIKVKRCEEKIDNPKPNQMAEVMHFSQTVPIEQAKSDSILSIVRKTRHKDDLKSSRTIEKSRSSGKGFNFSKVLHIIMTDRKTQLLILNALMLYIPIFIFYWLLWLVIVKLILPIFRYYAPNQPTPQTRERLTSIAAVCRSHVNGLKVDSEKKSRTSQKLSCKSRQAQNDSDEEYQDSNTEFLTSVTEEKCGFHQPDVY